MSFQDQMLTDLEDMFDEDVFAQEITYDGAAITAIVDSEGDVERGEIKGPDSKKIWIKNADVAQVNQGAPVVINSTNWMVEAELFSDGYQRAIRVFSANTVTIARGEQTCTALATCIETVHERDSVIEVSYVDVRVRGYKFRASTYAPTGVASIPAVGDRITDNEGTFEVLSKAGNPHFYYRNRSREQIIVFTKEI